MKEKKTYPDVVSRFSYCSFLSQDMFHTLAQTIIARNGPLLATACSILHGYSQCDMKGKAKTDMNNERSAK